MLPQKHSLGRAGEYFVMQKLQKLGYNIFVFNPFDTCDLVIKSKNKRIKIEIKTTYKPYKHICSGNALRYGFHNYKHDFDFLIFTNLKDFWIFPKQLKILYNKRTYIYANGKYELFKNNFKILKNTALKNKLLLKTFNNVY